MSLSPDAGLFCTILHAWMAAWQVRSGRIIVRLDSSCLPSLRSYHMLGGIFANIDTQAPVMSAFSSLTASIWAQETLQNAEVRSIVNLEPP